MRIMSDYAAN